MPIRVILALLLSTFLLAQTAIPPDKRYERLVAIVPMVGKGTYDDPRRPMFVPPTGERDKIARADRKGILGYGYEISDDGNSALIEFVALSRQDFKEILDYTGTDVQKAEKFDRTKRDEVLAEFKRRKKDAPAAELKVNVQ